MRSDDLQGAKALREASGCTHSASFALRLPISFTVDRTSNRKWKRIRNFDRIKSKELVDALFEMNLDE